MKARIKATGEVIDVNVWASQEHGEFLCYYRLGGDDKQYSKYELDFNIDGITDNVSDGIDWNEKLIQLSGMAMQGLLSSPHISSFCNRESVNPEKVAKVAVVHAKELIKQLKEE